MTSAGFSGWKRLGLQLLPLVFALPACEGVLGIDFDEVANEPFKDASAGTGGASPGGAAGTSGGAASASGGSAGTSGGTAGTSGGTAGISGGAAGTSGGAAGSDGTGGISSGGTASTGGAAGTSSGGAAGTGGSMGIAGTGGCGGQGGSTGGKRCVTTIAELKTLPDGPVFLLLEDVYVTYLRTNGYTVQAASNGPAILVFTGTVSVPIDVQLGNRVTLEVDSVTTFHVQRQITSHTVVVNDRQFFDVLGKYALDLSAQGGIALGPGMDARLVKVQGATAVAGTPPLVFTVKYGTGATTAPLRLVAPIALCVGATFDIRSAMVGLFDVHQIEVHNDEDIVNLNPSGCAGNAAAQ